MEVLRYRGRVVTSEDVTFLRQLIAEHPKISRRALSFKVCEAWNWVQPNGVARDMVCRGLLLALHRAGHIKLPPSQWAGCNPAQHRRKPAPCPLLQWPAVTGGLSDIGPLRVDEVRRSSEERLFDSLVETHHYLGYTRPVGEHVKYLVSAGEVPIACLAWSSAPRHLGARDRFIGWSAETRRRNVHLIAYNLRFLILPWVQVRHLASHLLARMARQVSVDWQQRYHHPIYFLETFVDPQRFRGTCYRAANWIHLGQTTGRGKDAPTKEPNRPIKEVLGYPLSPRFRELLCDVQ